jgi:hypothetical protein
MIHIIEVGNGGDLPSKSRPPCPRTLIAPRRPLGIFDNDNGIFVPRKASDVYEE